MDLGFSAISESPVSSPPSYFVTPSVYVSDAEKHYVGDRSGSLGVPDRAGSFEVTDRQGSFDVS